jgi:hypothetical protein
MLPDRTVQIEQHEPGIGMLAARPAGVDQAGE